jgi:gluconate 2-dehydrogenase gamma chain
MSEELGRRNFLKKVAVAGTAAAAGITGPTESATAAAIAQQSGASQPANPGYTFLTGPEAAFIEAFVDVLIPADDLTPSGTDLGVAIFIDRQLAGGWGKGDRLYRQGPWQKGSPGQGYQLPLAPADFFRAGIDEVTGYCKKTFGKEFDRLTPADKQKVLEGLDRSSITLDRISGKQFFDIAYQAAMEGLFSDPIYGGNRDKTAWKMIGYPGVLAVHGTNIVTYRNKQYTAAPRSIADLM